VAKAKQLPADVDIEFVAGDEYTVTFTATSGVTTFSVPSIAFLTASGDAAASNLPTVSAGGAVLTASWSAANSAALNTTTRAKNYKYSVRATADGSVTGQVFGGTCTIHPVGTTGLGTSSSVAADVYLGGTSVTATVSLGGTVGQIDGGSAESVFGGTSSIDGGGA
jgi:hypothetical protein